ncbi:MAG: glycosyl hydrolase family 8 [Opitutaceae bacterium]
MKRLTVPAILIGLTLGARPGAGAPARAVPPPVQAARSQAQATPDLFGQLLGKSDTEVSRKIDAAWRQLFYGEDATQRVFYPVPGDMAYIADIANQDVRTEGMSYGMMIAVQLGHRKEFDELWRFAKRHMYHDSGPYRGYFAWHTDFSGRPLDQGPAPDGEEWFAMALFFASHRWGDGTGIFDYGAEAQAILHTMLHKDSDPARDGVSDMFDPRSRLVVFGPGGPAAHFTDPSYMLPAFYELWARWAAAPADRAFFAASARASRALWKRAANPRTGLMPDYCHFDGTPVALGGHGIFEYDAWRTLSYPAWDYSWWAADRWEVAQSDRVLRFFSRRHPHCPGRLELDGTPVSTEQSKGLCAMEACAGMAADPTLARPFVRRLWEMKTPEGRFRYYDGLLMMLGLLECGGRFRIYAPRAGGAERSSAPASVPPAATARATGQHAPSGSASG